MINRDDVIHGNKKTRDDDGSTGGTDGGQITGPQIIDPMDTDRIQAQRELEMKGQRDATGASRERSAKEISSKEAQEEQNLGMGKKMRQKIHKLFRHRKMGLAARVLNHFSTETLEQEAAQKELQNRLEHQLENKHKHGKGFNPQPPR